MAVPTGARCCRQIAKGTAFETQVVGDWERPKNYRRVSHLNFYAKNPDEEFLPFFSMKDAPAVMREVFVTCRVSSVYEIEGLDSVAADCVFTSLKEEDCRFLYEKATSSLFN